MLHKKPLPEGKTGSGDFFNSGVENVSQLARSFKNKDQDMIIKDGRPPAPDYARRIWRSSDLPPTTAPALYGVTNSGQEPRNFRVSKQARQELEGSV